MTKELAKATAPFGSLQAIDPKKLEQTIEQMYFQGKDVTPEQKLIFRHAVERTGLDPIVGQIRPVLRQNNKTKEWQMAIQTSIDGYRLIADRTGLYAGSDDPVYEDDPSPGSFKRPAKATVTVWKFVQGQRCAFTATARWSEYFPQLESQQFMWRKMPYLMLAKCAEALALRKAFPADLSGIYTDDEMQQAGAAKEEDERPAKAAQPKPLLEPSPAKPAKDRPVTKTVVMEFLTACKDCTTLQEVYDRAFKREWSPEDAQAITHSYISVFCRICKYTPKGDELLDAEGRVAAKIEREASGYAHVHRVPVPNKEEIAAAERAGMQAA